MIVEDALPIVTPLDSPLPLKVGVVHGQDPEGHAAFALLRRTSGHVSSLGAFFV